MKLGRERREGLGRDETARPSLFSFNRHFLRTRLLGINSSTNSKRKDELQAVYRGRGFAISHALPTHSRKVHGSTQSLTVNC